MTALLVIIYISFISLGLPDSLLGSAWPIMQGDLSASFSYAGYIAMLTSAGTIISSLFSNRMIARYGTGKVTMVSVLMTAVALFGISAAPSVWVMFIMAVPLGLGAGSVDAGLNNFVALHYKAKHMSWLHCFWGIGATAGPMIMSLFLLRQGGWRMGYLTIALIQTILVIILFMALPLWKKTGDVNTESQKQTKVMTNREAIKVPLVKLALVSFFFYCAVELTVGLWCSSYLVSYRSFTAADAARTVSMFYAGITVGRLLAGFAAMKIPSKVMVRLGQIVCILGAVLLIVPFGSIACVVGTALLGLGCAPIFPSMLHETPTRFGAQNSQAIMGLQMAFAYIGNTVVPPLFGVVASATNIVIFPYFVMVCILMMFGASELIELRLAKAA